MIHVSIQHHAYRSYIETPNCIVIGKAFYDDRPYFDNQLSQLVSSWHTEKEFVEGIQKLNGFYALVINHDKQLFAAVDRVRSIPLFYGCKGNDFFLSDSAEWIKQQVDNKQLNPLAKEEFLLTGYVTGQDTLFPDVKQLQAGEAVIVKEIDQGLSVNPIRYYLYVHEYSLEKSMEQLMEEHDQVLVRVFNRLIQVANGRTLVIPLSGGYDSRLIVLMLKRLGYENIITFSYGRVGNSESIASKKIAECLGVKWEFVEYSNGLWYQWYHSVEYKQYVHFAGGCTSLPHIQDWPAVWQLNISKKIPKDSIFIPGHSADLPAGSRSTSVPELYNNRPLNVMKVNNEVLNYHYSLFNWRDCKDEQKVLYMSRVNRTLENVKEFPDGASAFEFWDLTERQAKFIINSLRVYEFWGYDWWMPFWDYEYMQFWCSVALNFRRNQILYKRYVDELSHDIKGLRLDEKQPSVMNRIRKMVTPYLPTSVKRRIKLIARSNKRSLVKEYQTNPLAWWGIFSIDEYLLHAPNYANINSALAIDYINYVKNE